MDLTDQQVDSMLGMLTPETMNMAKNMYQKDPNGFQRQAEQAH